MLLFSGPQTLPWPLNLALAMLQVGPKPQDASEIMGQYEPKPAVNCSSKINSKKTHLFLTIGFAIARNLPGHPPATVSFEGHATSTGNESLSERLQNFIYAEKLPDYLLYDMEHIEELGTTVNSVPIGYHVRKLLSLSLLFSLVSLSELSYTFSFFL